MLTLITFKPALGLRSPSPFAVKAEALMAMSGLDYQLEYGDLRKAPRRKMPVLRVGEQLIPDTAHIQTYLENEHQIDFDSGLSTQQRAIGKACQRMIEHHLYFINAHFRWTEHGEAVKDAFFEDAPKLMRNFVFKMVRKDINKMIYLQGLGRQTRSEMLAFADEDLSALSTVLGEKKFLLDDTPTSFDASLYGALHGMIDGDLDTATKPLVQKYDNLVAYCDRFSRTVFEEGV